MTCDLWPSFENFDIAPRTYTTPCGALPDVVSILVFTCFHFKKHKMNFIRCNAFRRNALANMLRSFTANWLEGRTIKYTNFPGKYMNSRSKLHWNIHVVLCQVGVTWNNCWGIGIPEVARSCPILVQGEFC